MNNLKVLVNGKTLTTSAVKYYTTPASTRAVIKKATFVNDNTTPVTVNINIVPSGESAGYTNAIIKTHVIAAGDTWICYALENHVLEIGGAISMLASVTNKIGCRISGYEVI